MIKNIFLKPGFFRTYFLKTEIQRLLLTSVSFGFLLLLARVFYTGSIMFAFLVWNIFLAFVPWFISYTLTLRPAWIENRWKFAIIFTVWLLFIPNSFYMLTDLFHLYDSYSVPRWYDLMLIFCFVWNAMLMGILSVRHMEKIIQSVWLRKSVWWFVYPVMLLNAFGIYVGRYMRYNSWDIVSNPFQLLQDAYHILLHPVYNRNAWAMVIVFSFFLSIVYMMLRRLSRTS